MKKTDRLLWVSTLTLLFAALVLSGVELFTQESDLLASIQENVNEGLARRIETVRQDPQATLYKMATRQQDIIGLRTDLKGNLLYWNSNRFVPRSRTLAPFLRSGSAGLLHEAGKYYYCVPIKSDSTRLFFLIPLHLTSPIRNEYLQDYTYLGENASHLIRRASSRWGISKAPLEDGLNFYGPDKEFLFSLIVPDTDVFRHTRRVVIGILLLLSLILAAWGLHRYLCARLNGWTADGILVGTLLALRLLLLWLGLPGTMVHTGLFSSQVLAVNWLNPSLGDLTLNSLLLFLIVYRLYVRTPQHRVAAWLQRFAPASWLSYNVLHLLASFLLFQFFFYWFSRIVQNSKIYFEFSDLSRLDSYSYLVFLNIALLVFSIFLLQYLLAGITMLLKYRSTGPHRQLWLLLLLGLFMIGVRLLQPDEDNAKLVVFAAYILSVNIFRSHAGARLRFNLVQAATLFGMFAVITNFAVSRSLEQKRIATLSFYANNHYSQRQDPVTSYYFDEVVQNIQADESIWEADTTAESSGDLYQDIIHKVINNHLMNNIKGYDFRVFLFNGYKRRLDNQAELNPYPIWRNQDLMIQASATKTNLIAVPYNRSFTREILVSRFDVYTNNPDYGKVTIQVELYPKSVIRGKLYPQLTQNASRKSRQDDQYGFEIGVYSNGKLIQLIENSQPQASRSLPIDFESRYGHVQRDTFLYDDPAYYELVTFHDQNKAIVARVPRRTFFNQLTAVSFLFYFYLLLYLAYRLPELVRKFSLHRVQDLRHSFIARIEFFLVLISLAPLVIFWLLTTNVLNKYFQQEINNNLMHTLQHAGAVIEDNEGVIRLLGEPISKDGQLSRNDLNLVSNLLGTDLNIYDASGYLRATTRPRLYQSSLSSSYMNPEALHYLKRGEGPVSILQESIGNLSYMSGYIPLYNSRFEKLGYLNIPYLEQRDGLEYQIEKFLAYLINVYVFIILVLVLVGIFLSRTLTNPLTLLKQKLDETTLGLANEPIAWKSHDEIGRIIQSYNQMLEKLAESEKKLSKSQRDFAWKEMARQVAHEIKNPLTPMKLSVQHLARALQADPERQRQILEKATQTLLTQIESLTAIANSFSDFARLPSQTPEAVNLNRLLSDVQGLYDNSDQVKVSLQLPTRDYFIFGDPNQLNRVLVNLVQNAVQAMDKPDGRIEMVLYTKAGQAVVEVRDNGAGVPEDIRSRIFEPNFSTKTSGMGLGLAITKRMVEGMSGTITFESETGKGTTFILSFPLHEPTG